MDALVPDYTSLTFPAPPAGRPYVILNMVTSLDGRVTVEGTERGLGSTRDQRLMRELRVHADVTLNGAGTLRASGTSSRLGDPALEDLRERRGLPRTPIASVLSRSGDLPLDRLFFTARDFEAVVYLSDAAPADRARAVEATGRRVIRLPADDEIGAMLRHMRHELGAGLLLVEGGPTINGQLFDLGCVDEFFLTLGGVVVNGNHLKTAVVSERDPALDALTHLELLSAIPNGETNEVYLRYRVQR
jgi:2,5-diamino-6-(ribosylamino)-4(3H)-pyrimidinone 5'-phosphate reductase